MALTKNIRFLLDNRLESATDLTSDLTVENDIERIRDPIGARQAVFDGTTLNLEVVLNTGGKAVSVRCVVLGRTNLSKAATVVVQSKATSGGVYATRATITPWTQSGNGADQFGADEEGADGYPADEVDPLPLDPLWYAFMAGSADAASTHPYWRFVITDTGSATGKIAIGIVYIGDFWEAKQADNTEYSNADDLRFQYVDLAEKTRSRSGSMWANTLQIYREWQVNFSSINTQDLFDVWAPQMERLGTSAPFFAFFAPEDGATPIVTSRTDAGRESNRMAAYVIAENQAGLNWRRDSGTAEKNLTDFSNLTVSEVW